jgi:hypothetical protein
MLNTVLNALFGCAHRRTTFPITPGRRSNLTADTTKTGNKTYVVCLDCGREFDYDWKEMRVGAPVMNPAAITNQQTTVSVHH